MSTQPRSEEHEYGVNRFSLVTGTTTEIVRRLQLRALRIYLAATTFLYFVGLVFILFPPPIREVDRANPAGAIIAVVMGVFGLIYLRRGPANLVPAIAAAMIATPAVIAFHVLDGAAFLCLIAAMFLAMYMIAFLGIVLARVLTTVLTVSTVLALAVSVSASPLTYFAFVVAILGAAESFGLVTRSLVAIACTDALTGLPNRAGWEIATAHQLARACSAQTTLSVAALDVDNFKAINDEFGHQAGDQHLIEYARQLRTTIPEDAVLARLGGDEFAICIEGTSSARSADVLARIRSQHVDTSIGAAFGPAATVTIAQLLAEADADLYRVKRAKGPGELEQTS